MICHSVSIVKQMLLPAPIFRDVQRLRLWKPQSELRRDRTAPWSHVTAPKQTLTHVKSVTLGIEVARSECMFWIYAHYAWLERNKIVSSYISKTRRKRLCRLSLFCCLQETSLININYWLYCSNCKCDVDGLCLASPTQFFGLWKSQFDVSVCSPLSTHRGAYSRWTKHIQPFQLSFCDVSVHMEKQEANNRGSDFHKISPITGWNLKVRWTYLNISKPGITIINPSQLGCLGSQKSPSFASRRFKACSLRRRTRTPARRRGLVRVDPGAKRDTIVIRVGRCWKRIRRQNMT